MTATTASLLSQLRTLREHAARDLEAWRGVLAEYEARYDSQGVALATNGVWRLRVLLIDIDELLAGLAEERQGNG